VLAENQTVEQPIPSEDEADQEAEKLELAITIS
jgi:hypothetical protein